MWASVWAGDFSLSLSLSLLALFGTLKFLNALFLGFCALFVILSLCKKATQRVARRKPQQKNPQRYFANAQYDKFRQKPKFDSLPRFYFVKSCKDGYFHTPKALFRSNFRDKIYKFYSFLWIATLALLARNDGKTKIQIFYSKFKAFCKFNSFYKFHSKFKVFHKSNSFYNFISNFKPYTRLFHIFTPSFCSVFTDKFTTKEFLWTTRHKSTLLSPCMTSIQGC